MKTFKFPIGRYVHLRIYEERRTVVGFIMVIELSGVQFGQKSYAQREFDLKSQV